MSPAEQIGAGLPSSTIVVLLGVSGSGKTTIGKLLASRASLQFADADDYHSESNKRKMASGEPLTDADREPWLERLNALLRGWQSAKQGGVLACSALKGQYRATLSAHLPPKSVCFVLLDVSEAQLQARLAHRHHPFMNSSLLASQIATLERPEPGEAMVVCNDRTPDEVVSEVIRRLAAGEPKS